MRRAVLAGCGGVSRGWVRAVKSFDDVKIVGLVDINPEAIKKHIEEFDLSPSATGSDLAEVIRQSSADTVFDCTIPSAHRTIECAAMEQGCDVLGEKPLSDSMADALMSVKTAQKTGKIYAVIQNRRYNPEIIRYRDALSSGEIGPLTTLDADFYIGAHFGGFRDEMQNVLIVDMAIHSFDEARFLTGADPVSVYCHEWNPSGSWYKHGASAVAIFEMTGGLLFTYRGSWCSEGMNTSWECQWRAIGEKGTLLWDGNDHVGGQKVTGNEGFQRPLADITVPQSTPIPQTGHAGVIRNFLDSLKSGAAPQTICTDNIKSVAMIHAAVESADRGIKVQIAGNPTYDLTN